MKVSDIMTQDVVTIRSSATVADSCVLCGLPTGF